MDIPASLLIRDMISRNKINVCDDYVEQRDLYYKNAQYEQKEGLIQ
jgi:hypothetical protein